MSLVMLECPICEFVFEADLQVTHQARCTCCGHLFAPSRSTIQPSRSSDSSDSRPPPGSPPSLPQKLSEKNVPSVADDSPQAVGRADQLRSSIVVQRAKARRRSNLILLLLFVGTLVAGALVAKRFRTMEQHRLADSNVPSADSDVQVDSAVTPATPNVVQTGLPNPPPKAEQTSAEREAPKPAVTPPVDPPKFLFLSSSVAADQAASLKPYMMLLEIQSPTGTSYATGTIVDSRGYLLTSLGAVTGATKITASSARSRSQIKNQVTPPESDAVRSVVAVSNSQQWALLEINRRFVLNAADIRIPERDRIVSRQPLFRINAPRSQNDYAVSEMRVDQRRKSSELATEQKELLNIAEGDEDLNWIISPHSPYDQLGAALVSPAGELMAVLVNFDQNSSYYIDTSNLGKLLKGNNFSKKPLSSLK